MSQCNELEQALKVADNPALGSTTERILAAEVRRLQAVNQTLNAIWEEVDTYARNHSEIQLGESVSQHALELMKDRDALKAELARMREQKPLTWGTSGELMEILKNPIYSSPAPVPAVAAVPEDYRQALVEIALRCTDHDTTDAIDALLQSANHFVGVTEKDAARGAK